jgi:DNA-binding transcriptional ArsR family regulator
MPKGYTRSVLKNQKYQNFRTMGELSPASGSATYLTHIPVGTYHEAGILAKESTWNILAYVRAIGASGAAADEISRGLGLPPSMVYSTLKELRRLEFVSIIPRDRRRAKERKKRYVCERITWGKYRIEGSFMNALELEGMTKRLTEKLRAPILELFTGVFEEFQAKSELRRFLPKAEAERICPICDRNHEATEFVYAAILAALDPYITESKEFRHLLVEKGYAR